MMYCVAEWMANRIRVEQCRNAMTQRKIDAILHVSVRYDRMEQSIMKFTQLTHIEQWCLRTKRPMNQQKTT